MLSRAANSKPVAMRRVGERAIRIAARLLENNVARIVESKQLAAH
jgi:hypothetical protein